MKKVLFGLLAFSSAAMAFTPLETVRLNEIGQYGNLMPGPGKPPASVETRLKLQVPSNGCTQADDFKLVVEKSPRAQVLVVLRVRPDTCKAFLPEGVEIELSTREVVYRGPVRLANPLRMEDHTAHF